MIYVKAKSNSPTDMNDALGKYVIGRGVKYVLARARYDAAPPGWEIYRQKDQLPAWYKDDGTLKP